MLTNYKSERMADVIAMKALCKMFSVLIKSLDINIDYKYRCLYVWSKIVNVTIYKMSKN